jgi:hypothetical protein
VNGWIGVDFDGTLARYDNWQQHGARPGPPIPLMLERVQRWLAQGLDVRIFTARVGTSDPAEAAEQLAVVRAWCRAHLGRDLPVTACKDFGMIALYDDRCVAVETNTGRLLGGVEL